MTLSNKGTQCIETAKSVGWDLGLSVISALLSELGNPQNMVPAVHITGTNGKGSTLAFLNEILIHAGYRVGRFTSPAVNIENERYTINNIYISDDSFSKTLDIVADACNIIVEKGFRHPSLFEVESALAFLYFYASGCDIMLIEVGMGGLLDATNVISEPLLCVFANIGYDHMQWLGSSLAEITKNKAGIIRPGAQVVSSIQPEESASVLKDVSKSNGCDIEFVQPFSSAALSLNGTFQLQNAALAKACALKLRLRNFKISDEDINYGLSHTYWPFRFETINKEPLIILDGAHNMPAILKLKESIINNINSDNLTFVISVLKDKSHKEMFEEILPMANKIIVVETENPRALPLNDLAAEAQSVSDAEVIAAKSFNNSAIAALSDKSSTIICFGTLSFLQSIKAAFLKNL